MLCCGVCPWKITSSTVVTERIFNVLLLTHEQMYRERLSMTTSAHFTAKDVILAMPKTQLSIIIEPINPVDDENWVTWLVKEMCKNTIVVIYKGKSINSTQLHQLDLHTASQLSIVFIQRIMSSDIHSPLDGNLDGDDENMNESKSLSVYCGPHGLPECPCGCFPLPGSPSWDFVPGEQPAAASPFQQANEQISFSADEKDHEDDGNSRSNSEGSCAITSEASVARRCV